MVNRFPAYVQRECGSYGYIMLFLELVDNGHVSIVLISCQITALGRPVTLRGICKMRLFHIISLGKFI